jgi:PAS domain S-box-containing protein
MDLQQTMIFENLKAAIMATDCAGSIVYWNPFAEVLYGWQPEEVLGRDITEIALNSTTYEEANAPMNVVRAGQSWSGESMIFCKRGEYLPALITLSPLFDEDGVSIGIIGISQDLSGHKQADEELRKRQAELEKRVEERTAELVQSNKSLRALSSQLFKVQEDERRRIARELHDSTGQVLAALTMTLNRVQRETASAPDVSGFEECKKMISTVAADIRNLSYLLHPPLIDELGLGPAVQEYAQGFEKRSGTRVSVDISPEVGRLNQDHEIAFFRIIQEALGNIHRHSGSSVANISILHRGSDLVLEIRDKGHGLPASSAQSDQGIGLKSMRERLRPFGGTLEIESLDTGTTVTARLLAEPRLDLAMAQTA